MIWQKIAITISLLFWLLFAAIQTGDNARDAKNAKVVDEWLEEQVSRYENENSIPLKCPHCYLGWGFFENYETDESLIYCLWGEEKTYDWRSKIDLLRNWKSDLASAERFDHSDRVRLEALLEWPTDSKRKLEDSMERVTFNGDGGLNDRLIEARRRNKFKEYNSRCFKTFNKRESLDGFLNIMGDRHAYYTSVEENRNFERDEVYKKKRLYAAEIAAENAGKSPEQIELEKLNKKVEELIRKTKK